MNEDLLHYIWKFQLFNHSDLKLTNGESLFIKNAGLHNFDSGPDFFNSRLKIDSTTWAGNVEIHLFSSDWYQHKHQDDEAYDRVILHVVWENDKQVEQLNGTPIPTLELKGRVSKSVIEKYADLKTSEAWIPCENDIRKVNALIKEQVISQKLVERLEQKSERINQLLQVNKNNWEAILYQLLAKYFGFKTNAVPFELLAASIDFNIVRKHRQDHKQLAALFFGQAGFLNHELKGNYPLELKKEYEFLRNKYQLQPLKASLWKFMRMRPTNFPTIRIAQFIEIYTKNENLFQKMKEASSVTEMKKTFEVEAYGYWDSHFRFDVPASKKQAKTLGDASINTLLINAVIPLLFNHGEKTSDENLKEKAMDFLTNLPAEKNSITKKWKELKMPLQSAYDSQGLIQLKNNHCRHKNCLNCTIGNTVIKNSKNG